MVRSFLISVLVGAFLVMASASAEATPDVFKLATDLEVNSKISGDVVVLAGDLTLGPEARIQGDAVAVLGTIHLDEGAQVDGRVIALSSLSALDPDPIRGGSSSSLRPGLFLVTGGCWLVVTTLLAFIWPLRLRSAVGDLRRAGWRLALLGLVVVVTMFAALVAVLGLGPIWGVPLAGCLMVIFLMVKAVGLAVVGARIGGWVPARLTGQSRPISLDVFIGVAILLMVRLIPILGGTLWSLVSVVALGVGMFSILSVWSTSAKPVSIPLT